MPKKKLSTRNLSAQELEKVKEDLLDEVITKKLLIQEAQKEETKASISSREKSYFPTNAAESGG